MSFYYLFQEDGDTHKRRDGERKHRDCGGGENRQGKNSERERHACLFP